jgi:hypothetical protein
MMVMLQVCQLVSNDRRAYFMLDDRVRLRDEKDPESNNKMVRVLSVIARY